MRAKPIVEMESVGVRYPSSSHAVLENVSFAITQGEILGLTGASGSGKTTLLRLLAGSLAPSSGGVTWTDGRRPVIAYCPQDDVLLDYRNVWENAVLLLERAGGPEHDRPAANKRVREMLDCSRLLARCSDMPRALSGGMRQRVQVIQALATSSGLRLLDEPFAQQDRDNQRTLERFLCDIGRSDNSAAVLVSHDIDSLAAVCDRTLFLGGAPAGIVGCLELPKALRALNPDLRRDDPAFGRYNEQLWSERAKASLV